jgi:hypothetical protein
MSESELSLGPLQNSTTVELKIEAHLFKLPGGRPISFAFTGPYGLEHQVTVTPSQEYGRSAIMVACSNLVLTFAELELIYLSSHISGLTHDLMAEAKGITRSGIGNMFHRAAVRNSVQPEKVEGEKRKPHTWGIYLQSRADTLGITHPDFITHLKENKLKRKKIT